MKILQIATTAGQACGIGNFALNLEFALREMGIEVETRQSLADMPGADVVLIQHGYQLFEDDAAVTRFCAGSVAPVVIFAHDVDAEKYAPVVDGYVNLAGGILKPVSVPALSLPHPAWVPDALEDRAELKQEFGLPDTPVLGSSGFLMVERQFPEILERLLPEAERQGWFIDLVTSRWLWGEKAIEQDLEKIRQRHSQTMRFGTNFANRNELNRRLQACDILWCWTTIPSAPYGSGTISDQYGSGTHIYAAQKEQHHHVFDLPNVSVGAARNLDEFVGGLISEAISGNFTRHDPAPISWRRHVPPLVKFLSSVGRHRRHRGRGLGATTS